MNLLANAVEAWRACVAGVALQVALAREGWHRTSGPASQKFKH